MIISSRQIVAAASVIGAAAACSPRPSAEVRSPQSVQAGSAACAPAVGKLPAGTNIATLAGNHRVTLVATSGPRSGGRASADLRLVLASSASSNLTGSATVSLDSIGATAPGAVPADRRYLITGVQWASTTNGVSSPEITLRFGSIPSPPGTQTIEGSFMAMHLTSIAADRFTGTWGSGAGDQPTGGSGGYFCAQRVQ